MKRPTTAEKEDGDVGSVKRVWQRNTKELDCMLASSQGTVIRPCGRRREGRDVRLNRHHMDSIVYKFDSHRCGALEKNKV